MASIEKTEGIVLRKVDYGDTSKIVTFYTSDFGKISGILKGAKSPKSKLGMQADLLNKVEIVLYKKESRHVQTISHVEIVKYFPRIKEDLERLKYASGIIELVNTFTPEEEHNRRLFKGIIRILDLMETTDASAKYLFTKFSLFFISEIGYEIGLIKCVICDKNFDENSTKYFNLDNGFMCGECGEDHIYHFKFNSELFNTLICLSTKKNDIKIGGSALDEIISFLEKYLSFHVAEFSGLKSLKIY